MRGTGPVQFPFAESNPRPSDRYLPLPQLADGLCQPLLEQRIHPLMRRMHKPEPNLPPDAQDKRSVIPIDAGDVEQWLRGTVDEAQSLLRLAPVETFDAGPVSAASQSLLL